MWFAVVVNCYAVHDRTLKVIHLSMRKIQTKNVGGIRKKMVFLTANIFYCFCKEAVDDVIIWWGETWTL